MSENNVERNRCDVCYEECDDEWCEVCKANVWECKYCGDKINNEIKDCGCNNTYDTTACPCEYCDKIHPFSDCEYLETKCGCEIITNSREHDECRCDDDGENWICSDCYKGEYDEKENALGCCSECAEELVEGYWWSRPERGLRFCADCGESVLKEEEEEECYGKHCSETQGLKLCVGWNMNYCLDNKRFTENLFCDYCEKLNCYTDCVWCSENYKLTDMVYRCGGGFTDKDAYGNKCMFCKDCVDIIAKRLEC